jgi:hypothetical protein
MSNLEDLRVVDETRYLEAEGYRDELRQVLATVPKNSRIWLLMWELKLYLKDRQSYKRYKRLMYLEEWGRSDQFKPLRHGGRP